MTTSCGLDIAGEGLGLGGPVALGLKAGNLIGKTAKEALDLTTGFMSQAFSLTGQLYSLATSQ
jgi:hypothetical protein